MLRAGPHWCFPGYSGALRGALILRQPVVFGRKLIFKMLAGGRLCIVYANSGKDVLKEAILQGKLAAWGIPFCGQDATSTEQVPCIQRDRCLGTNTSNVLFGTSERLSEFNRLVFFWHLIRGKNANNCQVRSYTAGLMGCPMELSTW